MGSMLALGSSLLWGAGDFLGGRATQRHGALRVLAWSQLATLLLMWCAIATLASTGQVDVRLRTLGIAAAGGVAGVIGLIAFYRALAAGPMVLVPPLAATGVALPVVVGLASGDAPSSIALVGLAIAIVGVILASTSVADHDESVRIAPSTLLLCAVAAVGFALIFVALDAAAGSEAADAVVATGGVRIGSLLTVLIALAFARVDPRVGVTPRIVGGFVLIGVLDTGANLTFAIATTLGRLEVVAVLGSLYPAVTSALAALVLREQISRVQLAGVVVTLAGIALLARG